MPPSAAPSGVDHVPANGLERLLLERHSCRAFLPGSVPEQDLERLFRMAQRAPSWCNTQPWQVTLVSGAARDRLSEALLAAATAGERGSDLPAPAGYTGVYRERRRESAYQLYASLDIERENFERRTAQARENLRFFGAPHVAVITTEHLLGPYGVLDCGGYISTLLLAAESLGVAAIPQAAIAMHSDAVRRVLGLSGNRLVVAAVSLGIKDESHPANSYRTSRADSSEAMHRFGP
jgi:nitroreductase